MPEETPSAALDALRVRGAQRRDPVRFRLIEAFARRAAAHEGAARQVLDERLAALVAACRERLDAATAAPVLPAAASAGGPLAELVAHVQAYAAPAIASADALPGATRPGLPAKGSAPPELKTVQYFRRTWSKLSADQRLAQSRSALPENAGPLHSHQLVHRSLTLMRDLSPDYLERFVSYVDALLWIDQATGGGGAAPGPARPGANRKPSRGKAG